ncbi:uncharacterized protein LOC118502379 [Anopheles stephensi]|uniref:uncharacterized protein LOC118502379 n=1 Tax=Anopheles stephensi TaxID=30069 RepID=UPI0016589D2E|nr:uncharacterized protein LOC118502379 [Anopheles stephensi]
MSMSVGIVLLAIGLASFHGNLNVHGTPLQPKLFGTDELEPRAQLDHYRLNDDVWPTHYDIEIKPYFEPELDKQAFTFDGSTAITVTATKENVTQIKLHKANMNIVSWKVMRKSNSMLVRNGNDTYDEETQILTLHLNETLLKNVEYLMVFNYVGVMEENMRGFYRSYYYENGVKVWLGSTQFEQTEARRAFPCFDEPRYKTTFQLKLEYRHLEYDVFSNTPIQSSSVIGNNRTLATFSITPQMSSYLLAFIVAPYNTTGDNLVRVLSRPEATNQTAYSVSKGTELLQALGNWVQYPFNNVTEITHMYMAAVPDFAAGAMENWGLITYRESSLLYVPEDATSLQQQRIATIISHELAHQWFGNLVTCEWWDVTWLNEGFATYFEYFGTALVEPTWELYQQFVVEKLHTALQADSSLFTHPMTHPVYTQSQASAIFDSISYNKGGVVLRMLEHYMTKEVFQAAVREYVKDRQVASARPEHLFAVLDKYNVSASALMEPWTTQPGFPLVTVTGSEHGFSITQQRFLSNGTTSEDKLLWPLPITYATKVEEFENTEPTIVASESYNISLADASNVQYFVLNNQQVGYYRVHYDEALWEKIGNALRSRGFGGIHVLNRAQIVDDLFNLARADVMGYRQALDLLEYLREETEYVPWMAAANGLATLSLRVHSDDEHLFSQHVLDMFGKIYEYVGFQTPAPQERRLHTYLRRVVLDWTCRYGHEDCTKNALKEFEALRANSSAKIHPDLRQVVYCEGVRRGSIEQFDFLLNLYLTTNVATEQQLTLQGMSCATEEAVVHKFMNLTSSSDVRSQDKSAAFAMLLNNQGALEPATSYLVENSARWAEAHGGYEYVAMALGGILSRVKNETVKATVAQFAEANKQILGPDAFELINKGLEEFDNNQQFTMNHRDEILGFLTFKAASGTSRTVIFNFVIAMCLALVAFWYNLISMTLAEKLALVAIVTCACAAVSRASPLDPERYFLVEVEPRAQPEEYLLNDDVWPSHYDIEIKPYLEPEGNKAQFTFDGSAKITVSTQKQDVRQIKLHKARMEISAWSVTRKSDNTVIPTQQEMYDEETEVLTLPLTTALEVNVEYVLSFTYVGNMDDDMHGFYRSYYWQNEVKVWIGSTQFQQTHARRAFPCFDEPKFKATFQLKINHKTQYNVYSNTPITGSMTPEVGRSLTTFGITPTMSSYLVAFIVAPYDVNERSGMGILARPQAKNQTEYSLSVGIDLLKALGDWIDYPYTNVPAMTRMYMAAVPDFSAGAMENWGLLTYRETNILYRSDDSTSMQQQRIAAVISHEIAHQWFGDLVTCEWWDVTWLNEGFARYYQYFGTALVETDWDLEDQFVVEQLQGVMQMDSLMSTHPMTHPVYTQSQVSGIFDNISYNKGAVTLRMMEHYLGTVKFQTALRAYIKDRAFKTTRPADLFNALNRYDPSASSFMEPWTVQPGYPLVTVTSRDGGFTLTQKRFLVNEPDHTDQSTWPLPITYATDANGFSNTVPVIHADRVMEVDLQGAADVEYFILNNQQVGYYRVNYDAILWGKISKALHSEGFGGIHVLNRAQIVDDLFNLARADIVPYGTALEILEYLKDETEYAPWLAAINGLTTLSRRVHADDEKLFALHILDIFSKAYDTVKFQAPSATERRVFTYMRQNVLQWACNYGHDECSKAAVAEFDRYHKNPSVKVHPDLRQVVYCEGIRKGSMEQFEFLWNEYLTTNMATEQILILQGLSCASTSELITIMLDAIVSPHVRSQDKNNAYTYVINNPYTLPYVSRYLQQHHAIWATAFGSYSNVASAFNNLLTRLKSDSERDAISAFIETNKNTLGQSAYDSIKNGLADYESNKQFTLRNRGEISEFLDKKINGGAATMIANVSMIVGLLMLVLARW